MLFNLDESKCCTLLHLINMNSYQVAANLEIGQPFPLAKRFPSDIAAAYPLFIRELKRARDVFDRDRTKPYRFKDRAIIHSPTIHTQVVSEQCLKMLGFTRAIGPIKKNKHPENQLSLWVISVSDFLKTLEAELEKIEKEVK